MISSVRIVPALLFAVSFASAEEGWWMREPIRWLQTNLRETDAALDSGRFLEQVAAFRANVLHFGMGGITAYYPTKVAFHYPSPFLKPGRDLFGEVLNGAHARGIRVVGRFDLSKTRKEVYDAHPEWFFRQANGDPVIYSGLYSTCINGGYYREQGMKILAEALEKYDVDGLFFNMFGNQSHDYSGKYVGLCHCENCKRTYRAWHGKELPAEMDEHYRQFMFRCSREVASEIGRLIHAKRPGAGYFNYIQEYTDGIMSESNTVGRPMPLWPYHSSDNVNRARNSEPGKMSINLCMQFLDYPWRFATVPQQEIALRLWQNVAQGGALAFAVNGTLEQQDMQAVEAARPVFRWLSEHDQYYAGQQSLARVLLLGGSSRTGRAYSQAAYRGLFRFLSEEHIPFAVSDNMNWTGTREFDLVVAADWAPAELEGYIKQGGRALIVSSRPPEFAVAKVGKTWRNVEGYFRVRDRSFFPSLRLTSLVMLDGDYTEAEGEAPGPLTFVPPSTYAPPEKIHVDMADTAKPGLIWKENGRGLVAWIPWNLSALYYKYSLPAHAGILRDVMDRLLPARQLRTNAHPLVEMSLTRQQNHTLLHVINLSGVSTTAHFAPVPMPGISIELEGRYRRAQAIRHPAELPVRSGEKSTRFTLPALHDYELIVLE